jgi:hypothetical protein
MRAKTKLEDGFPIFFTKTLAFSKITSFTYYWEHTVQSTDTFEQQ